MIIVLIILTPITYAKYIDTLKMNFNYKIANPIFNIEEGDIAQINITNNIGYYEFSINNYKNEEISDVSFGYIIEIVSDIEDNIEFELYQEDNQIALENLKTEKIYIKGGEKTQQKYKLKMIYKGKAKDQLLFEKVHIKIKSEQEKI